MAEDTTITRRLDDIATKLESIAGIDPGALKDDHEITARLARILEALQNDVLQAHVLGAHLDVVLGSEVSGDFLRWDGTNWVNETMQLSDATDTGSTTPTSGNVLRGDGTLWESTRLELNDLADVDTGVSPILNNVLIGQTAPNVWTPELLELITLDDVDIGSVAAPTQYDLFQFNGSGISGEWEARSIPEALDGAYVRRDGTLALTNNWDAGNFKITTENIVLDGAVALVSHDKLNIIADFTETASVHGRTYRGIYMDFDYNYANAGGFDNGTICGLTIDADITSNAIADTSTPQLINAVITGDAGTTFGNTAPDVPVYMRVQSNKTNQGFADGAVNMGLEAGATSSNVVGVRAFGSASGAGLLTAYQGYAQGIAGATGQTTALDAFVVTQPGMARIVGVNSSPQALSTDGTPGNDKIMAFKGINGHCLISGGSIFATSTSRNDLSVFATTHLTHTNLDGDGYFEGKLEVDDTGYFDATGSAISALGDILIAADSKDLKLGAGGDMDIGYDGADGYINTNIVAASDLKIDCGTAKTLELQETVWDDLRTPVSAVRRLGFTDPDWAQIADDGAVSVGIFILAFADNAAEEVFFALQMPHGYKEGTDLEPHIHWAPFTADTGDVEWSLEYTIANIDGTFGNTTDVKCVDAGDGTIAKHQVCAFATISGAGLTISHMILCRLYRDGGAGNDDLSGDAGLLEFDIHFEKDTMGSRQMLVK